jgi:hypothetical protein
MINSSFTNDGYFVKWFLCRVKKYISVAIRARQWQGSSVAQNKLNNLNHVIWLVKPFHYLKALRSIRANFSKQCSES